MAAKFVACLSPPAPTRVCCTTRRAQGAGGVITDWRGQPLRWPADGQGDVSACSGEVVAAGDAAAHRQAVELLAWK